MIDKRVLLSRLKPYVGSLTIVKYDQGTGDIIKELLKAHKDEAKEYDKIYAYFVGNNNYETAKNIFNFLKRNVRYNIEAGSKQTLKSASSIIAQGYGDCKHYSQLAGGILDAISRNKKKINWCYRFASYNDKKQIQHVFVVIKNNDGSEIWIDPVLNKFNEKKEYTYKVDKKPMALYRISGVGNDQVGKFLPGLKKVSLKNVAKVAKKAVKAVAPVASIVVPAGIATKVGGKILKSVAKKGIVKKVASKVAKSAPKVAKLKKDVTKIAKVKKVIVKVGNDVSRNAFLTLVSSNKGGIASKLNTVLSNISEPLKAKWQSLGGNYDILKDTISKGSQSSISGFDKNFYGQGIGAVSSNAIYVSALPTIKALQPILQQAGVSIDDFIKSGTSEAIDQVSNDIIPTKEGEEANKEEQPNIEQQKTDSVVSDVNTSGDTATLDIKSSGTMDYKKFMFPALAVVGIYILTKKR